MGSIFGVATFFVAELTNKIIIKQAVAELCQTLVKLEFS